MATQLIGSGAYLSPAHQPALTKPALLEPVKSAIAAIRSAFNEATADRDNGFAHAREVCTEEAELRDILMGMAKAGDTVAAIGEE